MEKRGANYDSDFEKLGDAVVERVSITRASVGRPAVVIDCRAFGRKGPVEVGPPMRRAPPDIGRSND